MAAVRTRTLYIGADFSRREEMRKLMLRPEMFVQFTTTSDWLYTALDDKDYRKHWKREAMRDFANIDRSELCVFFTEEPGTKSRGGRHMEYAWALARGKNPIIIGPVESQFYELAAQQFDTIEEFIAWAS